MVSENSGNSVAAPLITVAELELVGMFRELPDNEQGRLYIALRDCNARLRSADFDAAYAPMKMFTDWVLAVAREDEPADVCADQKLTKEQYDRYVRIYAALVGIHAEVALFTKITGEERHV